MIEVCNIHTRTHTHILTYYMNKLDETKLNIIKRFIKLRFAYLQKYTLILNTQIYIL